MALKTLLLITLLVASMATVKIEAQINNINNLLGFINFRGTVYCTINGTNTITSAASQPPVFPNAVVELKCGDNVIGSTMTNESGNFEATIDPFSFIISSLSNSCDLRVETPLSTCNSTLPSGGRLLSALQFLGNTFQGQSNVGQMNFIPVGFQFEPSN